MPSPRSDFDCAPCAERFELPIAAKACPVCAGPLVRIYSAQVQTSGTRQFLDPLIATLPTKPSAPDPHGLVRTVEAGRGAIGVAPNGQPIPAPTLTQLLPGVARGGGRPGQVPLAARGDAVGGTFAVLPRVRPAAGSLVARDRP